MTTTEIVKVSELPDGRVAIDRLWEPQVPTMGAPSQFVEVQKVTQVTDGDSDGVLVRFTDGETRRWGLDDDVHVARLDDEPEPSALAPLQSEPDTIAGQLHAVAAGTVVLDVVKEQVDRLRDRLQAGVEATSQATGTAFTARLGGVGSAVLTDPQPKVSVADSQAFGAWLSDWEIDGFVESRRRVEVVDHEAAAAIIAHAGTPGNDPREDGVIDALFDLAQHCLKVVTEWYPADDAVDTLLSKGWAVVHGDHVRTLDPDTGEMGDPIPGLSVRTAKPTLQVRLDKDGREQARAQVRDALGLPELDGGV